MSARLRGIGRGASLALAAAATVVVITVAALASASSHAPRSGAHTGSQRPPLARNFTLRTLGRPGATVSLAAFPGRPVLINFFASWCGPCMRETPLLARFYASHRGQVIIIGVDANDQAAAALRFLRKAKVSYPVGFDPFPAPATTSYGVYGLPQTFFLNTAHRIVRLAPGPLTLRELTAWTAAIDRRPGPAAAGREPAAAASRDMSRG